MPIFATDTTKLPSGIECSEITKYIDSYIAKNEKTNAGLSLAIFAGGDILYEGYHGYADRKNGIAVDENSVMEWGSTTKMLVWVSVMQLVEKGELSLSTDITEYLPKGFFKKLQHDTPLTIYNLMHHNAGWEESMLELFVTREKNLPDLETALRRGEPKQIYKPGEFTAYSNWGVALAGYIVESVIGQPFYEYVHENIFDILEMEHTAINVDLSDNMWVKEQRNSLKTYTALGVELNIPQIYIPLYPAGMATGTLSDLLSFAMALIPDETGKSPLFQKAETLHNFTITSLYYADGRTARNSHGLWARNYAVPVIGHAGSTVGYSAHLQISPSSKVGVVVMTNQASEGVYNFAMMPLIFGEYEPNSTNMPDVAELEGLYLNTKTISSGMMKWFQLIGVMPFTKSNDNMLSVSPEIYAKQIEPYVYDLNLAGMNMPLKVSVTDERTMMSIPMFDCVKTGWGVVIFWFTTLILFFIAVFYALISLICNVVRYFKHKTPQAFGKLRMLNDISIILCLINLSIFAQSIASYMGVEFFFGTYTSALIQGIFFIIFALIPIVFTTVWIVGIRKQSVDKKQMRWLIISSIAGVVMTFNVVFWDLYML